MVRTPCCDKSGMRKGTWTPEEDRKLIAYVTRYGCWNWRQLPKFAGLARCGKSCRLRWLNYLRPNIKRGDYSKEEEDTIIRLHKMLGNKWSAIAAELPGRTDNEIKNHWHTTLKKRLQQKSAENTEEKEASRGPLQSEISQDRTRDKEVAKLDNHDVLNDLLSPITPCILESSLSSPAQSSSEQYSSTTTDNGVVTSKDSILDEISYKALFEEYDQVQSGSFWTEPFWSDNFYNTSNDMFGVLVDDHGYGYTPQYSPLFDGEMLCPYSFYE